MKDVIILLSHKCQDDKISDEYKKRIEKAAELYLKREAKRVVICGENANLVVEEIVKKGVKKEDVLIQKKSKDTVGEAFFSKKDFLVPNNWKNVIVVSSDYHIRYKANLIFDFILGKDFNIEYVEVKSDKLKDDKTIKDQLKSLNDFSNTFKNVSSADDVGIENSLLTKHKLYY